MTLIDTIFIYELSYYFVFGQIVFILNNTLSFAKSILDNCSRTEILLQVCVCFPKNLCSLTPLLASVITRLGWGLFGSSSHEFFTRSCPKIVWGVLENCLNSCFLVTHLGVKTMGIKQQIFTRQMDLQNCNTS